MMRRLMELQPILPGIENKEAELLIEIVKEILVQKKFNRGIN